MQTRFGLFFTRDNVVLRLPVNPEKLPVEQEGDNQEENVLGLGPITIPRAPKPRQVTVSSFFPGRPELYALNTGRFEPPEFYLSFFRSAMEDRAPVLYTPVRYYEDGTPFMTGDTGFPVLVSDFRTEERGGETGDFYYELSLVEYRAYLPQTLRPAQSRQRADGRAVALVPEPARSVPDGQLYVGRLCTVSGPLFRSSRGDGPQKAAAGRVAVGRIADAGRPCPVLVKDLDGVPLGWTARDALRAVEE